MNLESPRFEDGGALLIAGLSAHYEWGNVAGIPAQWRRFEPSIGHIPGQVGNVTYGVCRGACSGGVESMEYICGVEVSTFAEVPAELTRVRIPPRRYAVFQHRDHISSIGKTWAAILKEWLPASGYTEANSPEFERYGEEFDPRTGSGGLEIWIPLRG
jgi:AraC family transcriptional regulator